MTDWGELLAAAPPEVQGWLEEQDDDVVREARDLLESGQPGLATLEILELLDEPVEQLAAEGRQNEFYAWLRMIS
jgi:hypothetical protein